MLCLGYNVYTSFDKTSELTCAEKEDLYLSLDRDLAELLRVINEKVKTEHTLIVVTGTQSEAISEKTLSASRLPTGKFDGKRMMALLNSFLMAKYGQVRWVMNYADGNIFLNNTEIDNRNVPRYIRFLVANTRYIGYILCRAAPKGKRRQCRCSRKAKKLSMSRSLRRYSDFALVGLGRYRYRWQREQNIFVGSTVLASIVLRHQSRKVESRQPTLRYRYSSYPL